MLAAAEECAAPMPLASLVHDHLLSALAQGQGDLDWSSMTPSPGAQRWAELEIIGTLVRAAGPAQLL